MWATKLKSSWAVSVAIGFVTVGAGDCTFPLSAAEHAGKDAALPIVRSARSGLWSSPATWVGAKVPVAGASVQVRAGHTVIYDLNSDQAIRAIQVAGMLTFARDRSTRLDVGLIKIQAGDDASEDGFECDAHVPNPDPDRPRPALELGAPDQPIPAEHTATIRLVYLDGMNKE